MVRSLIIRWVSNVVALFVAAWALSGIDFASLKTVLGTNAKGEEVAIGWGIFINALIVFFVVMLVVYVIAKLFVKDEPAGPTAEESLLAEIRDELRNRPA